jgi:predicted small secreted protein
MKQKKERRNNMIRKAALLLLVVFCMALLTGCNTMQGLGKDIKSAGESLEDAAND